MGWTFQPRFGKSDKAEFIADRTKTQDALDEDGNIRGQFKCLKHSVRGNVLWAVWKVYSVGKSPVTFIECDLLSYREGQGWGYKDMEESMHPYQYSCPLSFLKMAPVASQEWRDNVMAFATKQKARTKYFQNLSIGQELSLTNGQKMTIVCLKPLHAEASGRRYRVPKKMIIVPA